MSVHSSAGSFEAGLQEAERVRAVLGFDYEGLDATAARRLVPQLEGEFVGVEHQLGYWMVSNPLAVLRNYQNFLCNRVSIVRQQVIGLRCADDTLVESEYAVVACGVWSRELVRQSGLKVLLETERGYSTTYTDLDWNLAMPVTVSSLRPSWMVYASAVQWNWQSRIHRRISAAPRPCAPRCAALMKWLALQFEPPINTSRQHVDKKFCVGMRAGAGEFQRQQWLVPAAIAATSHDRGQPYHSGIEPASGLLARSQGGHGYFRGDATAAQLGCVRAALCL